MTSNDWREKGRAASEGEAVDLALPSGMVIRARRPGPMQFAAWERLPLMLAAAAVPEANPKDEELVEIARLLRELLTFCCLAPRIVEEPEGEDEIAAREVPDPDWAHIVGWAMRTREAAAVRPFRGRAADDGGGSDGKTVRLPTIPIDGHCGPGAGAGVRPGGDAEGG